MRGCTGEPKTRCAHEITAKSIYLVTPQLVSRLSASNDSSWAFRAGMILRPYSYASIRPLQSYIIYGRGARGEGAKRWREKDTVSVILRSNQSHASVVRLYLHAHFPRSGVAFPFLWLTCCVRNIGEFGTFSQFTPARSTVSIKLRPHATDVNVGWCRGHGRKHAEREQQHNNSICNVKT